MRMHPPVGCCRRFLAVVSLVAALGATSAATNRARAQDLDGRALFTRFGCPSCHGLPGVTIAAGSDCVGCHQRVVARGQSGLGRAPTVSHYLETPSLTHVTRRLRRDYLIDYLQDPHDIRPRLEETMPRFDIGPAEADAIVDFLDSLSSRTPTARAVTGAATTSVDGAMDGAMERGRVAAGRSVFLRVCASCHVFGNQIAPEPLAVTAVAAMGPLVSLAPNLRFVRDRMTPVTALAWIENPADIDPGARMPRLGLSHADATAVRDFLFLGDLGAPSPRTVPLASEDIALLSRNVRFREVRQILGRSCIHCHAHGNGSGAAFGFSAGALDLSSYEGIRAGVRGPDGDRRSILDGVDGGPAPLLARLLRRHTEAVRDVVGVGADALLPPHRAASDDQAVGMPLGLPPLPQRDLSIIASWIAQGSRR